jgi:hypothetical protein
MHRNRPRPRSLGGAFAVNSQALRRACSQSENFEIVALGARSARRRSEDQWNWPSSVEPVNAVVDESGSTVVAMRSK